MNSIDTQAGALGGIMPLIVKPAARDWEVVTYKYFAAGGIDASVARFTAPSGDGGFLAPVEVDDAMSDLREVMYQPGVGTWFEVEMVIPREGKIQTRFNYDEEPSNEPPFSPGAYALDQRKFPRDVEHQPEWLQRKIADGLVEIGENE